MTAALCSSVTVENDNIEDGNKVVPESIDDYSSHWCEWALKKTNTIGENVKVISVNTSFLPVRKRRVGKFIGKKARYKRAIVKLASEDSITLFEEN